MVVLLLLSSAAAIGIGYLGAVAEIGVRKLHEIPTVRRSIERAFLFSLVEAAGRWGEERDWRWATLRAEIRRYALIASVILGVAIATTIWAYLAAAIAVTKAVLWLVVIALILAGLWLTRLLR